MKSKFLIIGVLTCMIFSCQTDNERNQHKSIEQHTDRIFDSLVSIRRNIHRHPELSGQETGTAKIVTQYLEDLGLEVKTGFNNNAVIGILKGHKPGKKVAWRADMDALPVNFPDEVPFRSKIRGIQHACGHDVHVAIALGIAEVLSKNKELLRGTLYFIFQPEEETFVGARNMVNSSYLSELEIDEIYATHVTALPVGQIMVKPDEVFAYQKRIQLTFDNEFSKEDAAVLYDQIRNQTLRKRDDTNPWEIPLAFDPEMGLYNPNTVFSDYFFLEENFVIEEDSDQLKIKAYAYETNKSDLTDILPKIEQVISRSAYKDHFISTSFIQGNPTVLNDESLTNDAISTLNDIYGSNSVLRAYGQIPYFNDDFIYFQQKIPGVYFLLGGSNTEKGLIAMNHAPDFRVDEECIRIGVKAFSSLILERVNK